MINNDDEKIVEIFSNLPEIIQSKISDEEWKLVIKDIIKENNLLLDVGSDLETEVFLIMLGVETQANLESNLSRIGIPKETIGKIELALDQRIFAPIKRALEEEMNNPQPQKPVAPEETRDDILKQIEDPEEIALPKITPRPMVAPTPSVAPTESTEPVAPVAPTVSSAPKTDPYREPIE